MEKDILIEQFPEEILRASNLPSSPTVTTEILKLDRDENAGMTDLVKVISADPALTTKLLKVANSAFYRRGAEVTTLQRAAGALGMKTVKTIALSFSLPRAFESEGNQSPELDYPAFWRQCLATAVAGRELARLLKTRYSEEAFLCGLLSHLGQLVMSNCLPEQYSEVLQKSSGRLPESSLELEILGFTHHHVAAAVMETWQFPELVATAVRYWDDPNDLPEDTESNTRDLCGVVHIAAHLGASYSGGGDEASVQSARSAAVNLFGIPEAEFDSFTAGIQEAIDEIAELFS